MFCIITISRQLWRKPTDEDSMNNSIKLKGIFVKKTESVEVCDGKFSTIATFLVDGREQRFNVITDGAWLNAPDKEKQLVFKGNIRINPSTNSLEVTSASWRYQS